MARTPRDLGSMLNTSKAAEPVTSAAPSVPSVTQSNPVSIQHTTEDAAPAAKAGQNRTLSVKCDADRYRKLQLARIDLGLTGQDIFIEAFDLWCEKYGR